MGFMELSKWSSSDASAEFYYRIIRAITLEFLNEFENHKDGLNTPGFINIALVAESLLLPNEDIPICGTDDICALLEKILVQLKEEYVLFEGDSLTDDFKRMIDNTTALIIRYKSQP